MSDEQAAPRRSRNRWQRRDLECYPMCGLSWKPEDSEASLHKVFEHVRHDALAAIDWYVRARRPKRIVAYSARFTAISLIGVAALLPLMKGILFRQVDPIWITLAIAAAAGAIGLDRSLGSSSGWIRCIKTELQLRDALESFELEWELARADWRGAVPAPEQTAAMLKCAKAFAAQVNVIVQEETNAWVEEFQTSISQIDEKLRSRAEAQARLDAGRPSLLNGNTGNAAPPSSPPELVAAGYQPHEWNDGREQGLL